MLTHVARLLALSIAAASPPAMAADAGASTCDDVPTSRQEGLAGERGTVEGVVLDSEGKPFASALVGLGPEPMRFDGTGPWWQGRTTGADGLFRFERVPAGDFSVYAMTGGVLDGRSERQRLKLARGEHRRVTLAFEKREVIRGLVQDAAGRPIAHARVSVIQPVAVRSEILAKGGNGGDMLAGYASSDESGRFEISGLPPGRYVASAYHVGTERAPPREFTTGEPLILVIPRMVRLTGLVLNESGGAMDAFSIDGATLILS